MMLEGKAPMDMNAIYAAHSGDLAGVQ